MTTYSYNFSIDELELSVLKMALKDFITRCEKEAEVSEDTSFMDLVQKKRAQDILARVYLDPVLTSTFGDLHLPEAERAPKAVRPKSLKLSSDAEFSRCRTYRYALWRRWEKAKPYVLFVGLNPSTADEVEDDPTLRRCYDFAKSWGYGGVCMVNLFAYRATDPKDMKQAADPIGPENDSWLRDLAEDAGLVIAAWGNHGSFMGRSDQIQKMLPNMSCLVMNGTGQPRHPLYVTGDTRPTLMSLLSKE